MSDASSLQAEIHERRQSCGSKLQPTYAQFLEMLGCVLANQLKASHPYQLNDIQLLSFDEKTKLFSLGGIGAEATLSGASHIYRIINKGHLPNFVKFRWPAYKHNPVLLWKSLMAKSRQGSMWLNLDDYAEDRYPVESVNCWFDCTWWTMFPLDENVVLGAYTIGMFAEWVPDEAYLMRAQIQDVNSLNVARVPTVLDAFMQPVFQPAEEASAPTGGVTINLSVYRKPSQGVNELSVKPFEVKFIEVKPVQVDLKTRQRYAEISKNDPLVLQSLVNYYDAL